MIMLKDMPLDVQIGYVDLSDQEMATLGLALTKRIKGNFFGMLRAGVHRTDVDATEFIRAPRTLGLSSHCKSSRCKPRNIEVNADDDDTSYYVGLRAIYAPSKEVYLYAAGTYYDYDLKKAADKQANDAIASAGLGFRF